MKLLKTITNKTSICNIFTFLLACIITISSIFPPLRALNSINLALLTSVCMLVWVLVSFLQTPLFYLRLPKHRLFSLLFILYSFIVPYLFNKPILGNRYLNISQIFIFFVIYEYYNYIKKEIINKNILIATIPFILITFVSTFTALITNPSISRSIKSSGEYSRMISSQGIGGYSFIYFIVLIYPIFLYIALIKTSFAKIYKIAAFILNILLILFILASNYFTAFFVIIVSSFILIIIDKFKKNKTIYFILTVLMVSIFLLIWEQVAFFIIDILVSFLGDSLTGQRLLELKNSILTRGKVSVETTRWDLFLVSLNSFIRYPIFGLSGAKNINIFDFTQSTGQHSHIMDTFAFLGFIPGVIQVYIMYVPFLVMAKNKKSFGLVIASAISFFLIASLNTVTPSFGFASYFILPIFLDLFINKKIIRAKHFT